MLLQKSVGKSRVQDEKEQSLFAFEFQVKGIRIYRIHVLHKLFLTNIIMFLETADTSPAFFLQKACTECKTFLQKEGARKRQGQPFLPFHCTINRNYMPFQNKYKTWHTIISCFSYFSETCNISFLSKIWTKSYILENFASKVHIVGKLCMKRQIY